MRKKHIEPPPGSPTCKSCGRAENDHNVRHPFVYPDGSTGSRPPRRAPAPANAEQPSPKVFTITELATRWRSSRHTVSESIRLGHLRAFRVGGRHWRIAESEVLRYESEGRGEGRKAAS